jgi:indole-3-glycerol phosphate synthase
MGNILDELADYARVRVARAKEQQPLEEIREEARQLWQEQQKAGALPFRFEKALADGEEIHFICECKKASPSKGLIAPEFLYLDIARQYEAAGAAAISVLTEPKWFLGSLDYLREISAAVETPCLRKDFTVDPYMIYEAKTAGASAILLIAAILDTETIEAYLGIADELGLSAIVEAHDEEEVASAVAAGARIIGVNNRNLKDFTVDIHNSIRLRELAPREAIFVAESGIKTPEDVEELRRNGVNAVLVGEQLMRATSPAAELKRLRGN